MPPPKISPWQWALAAIVALPWLNPFTAGPTPPVLPWLVSVYSVCALLMLAWAVRLFGVPAAPGLLRSSPTLSDAVTPVAAAWAAAGVLSCLIGLLQYFDLASLWEPWMSVTARGEAFGNLRQRNQFASLTNIALAALLWLAVSQRLSLSQKWLSVALACLLAIGNAASTSRTGMLQLLALGLACGVWQAWRKPVVWQLLLAAVLTYGLATLALPWLAGLDTSAQGMLARMRDPGAACTSRIHLWSNVLHLIGQKPWLGWGWNELDYAHYITLFQGIRFCDLLDNAHNLPLHLAVELGVPVTLLVCGTLAWWVLRQRPWAEVAASRQLAWSVLLVIGLHSLLEFPLWYGPFQIAAGLCLLFLLKTPLPTAGLLPPSRSASAHSHLRTHALLLAALGLLLAAAYATWDYRRISQIYVAPAQRLPAYREDTLEKIRGSWLFAGQVSFAELGLVPLTRDNADAVFRHAESLLHFSPEPKVIERVIESAALSGRAQDALFHRARYQAAYPKAYAAWAKTSAATLKPGS